MSCTIVVGGQYGSEGKGKVVSLLASEQAAPWVVRCGGPNSGHTVRFAGEERVLRQVPCGVGHPNSTLFLAAGSVVEEAVLADEVESLGLSPEQLVIDPRAVLLIPDDSFQEQPKVDQIGSTASGTGNALARRLSRNPQCRLAGDSQRLRGLARIEPVATLLHRHLENGGDVIVEGTQGFGLSLLHGEDYPYLTSRDTTAAAFASEVGLAPALVDKVVMVIRTFPIRVGGNSGPLQDELTWEEVSRQAGAPAAYPEFTSVTRRLRRVAAFNLENVTKACKYNVPQSLAIMGLDRLDFGVHRARSYSELSEFVKSFVTKVSQGTKTSVEWVGTGFDSDDAFKIGAPE